MDFWTQTGQPDNRHTFTHVAAGYVTVSWETPSSASITTSGSSNTGSSSTNFYATQDLANARINASTGMAASGIVNVSAIIDRKEDIMVARLIPNSDLTVTLSLSATNRYGLPITASVDADSGGLLMLDREANSWLDNAVVLSECDDTMSLAFGLRGVQLEPTTQRITWVNVTGPDSGGMCPGIIDHPLYGNKTIGRAICGADSDGKTDWR